MNYVVTYLPRVGTAYGGAPRTTDVEVSADGDRFYATNLCLWGCGKTAPTPEAAVRALVQDMAQVLTVEQGS